MFLTFLGKDSGFGDNNNSAYFEYNNELFLIDCGFATFNQVKNKFDFKKYSNINVIITHLHSDHAGTLSQLILYLWFVHNVKTTLYCNCKHIQTYLDITGAPQDAYTLKNSSEFLTFIKTHHVEGMDCYGFNFTLNDISFVYTRRYFYFRTFFPIFE